jgi:hypothetical protein
MKAGLYLLSLFLFGSIIVNIFLFHYLNRMSDHVDEATKEIIELKNRQAQPPAPAQSDPTPAQMPTLNSDGSQRQAEIPATKIFDWTEVKEEKFVLDAGSGNAYGLVPFSDSSLRYDIKSTQPVNTGVFPEPVSGEAAVQDEWQEFDQNGTRLCYAAKTLQTQMTCTLPSEIPPAMIKGARIFIRDTRTPMNALHIAGAYIGIKDPLKNATAQNRVTLTLYAWQCVRNCR